VNRAHATPRVISAGVDKDQLPAGLGPRSSD
jgi:hypothetical protein